MINGQREITLTLLSLKLVKKVILVRKDMDVNECDSD
jgi:hypothetical protein